jgi:hypothetical protein
MKQETMVYFVTLLISLLNYIIDFVISFVCPCDVILLENFSWEEYHCMGTIKTCVSGNILSFAECVICGMFLY